MGASPATLRAPRALPINAGHKVRRVRAARGRQAYAAPAGATASAPAWWGPTHWTEQAVPAAIARRPDLLREHHVSAGSVVLVARAMAGYADRRTGRDCRPTNLRLTGEPGRAEDGDAKVSLATLKRARAFLRDAGLLVEVVAGRSIMTRAERLTAWRNGYSTRQIAAEFALTLPRWLAPAVHRPGPRPVRHEPPPSPHEVSGLGQVPGVSPPGRKASRRSRAAPGTHRRARARPVTPAEVRRDRLIAGARKAVPWLSGVSPRRLRWLGRFAAHGWTQDDLALACGEVLTARGWTVPRRLTQPAAFLWSLLRDVDPADRPTAYLEARQAEEIARREWVWLTDARYSTAPECPHGHPAGNVPHPIDGHRACPFCRKDQHGPAL